MKARLLTVSIILALIILPALSALPVKNITVPPENTDLENPYISSRVHDAGNVWLTIQNWGSIGANQSPLPTCEFPAGTGSQYLFWGSLWMGAVVVEGTEEFPRVSTGIEGWFNNANELFPGEGIEHDFIERSNIPGALGTSGEPIYSPDAVSPQEFIAVYTDTLTDPVYVNNDPIDGPHFPLGLQITRKTMTWDAFGFDDFIIFEFTVENIGENVLKNPYFAYYIDADIWNVGETIPDYYTDDLTGFLTESGGETWDIPYAADNDGRPSHVGTGNDFTCPGIAGTIPFLNGQSFYHSYNYWFSSGNPDLDFGPSWIDDNSGGWTSDYGTPVGDERKYFLMTNREIDYDQVYCDDYGYLENNPQVFTDPFTGEQSEHDWRLEEPSEFMADIANGYDTRYLVSWGPFGENTAPPGEEPETWMYPGDSFDFAFAYVCGNGFHDEDNPQLSNTDIDPALFVFDDLVYNLGKAQFLAENDYQFIPPYAPRDCQFASSSDSAILISWEEYLSLPSTMFDIFRGLEIGTYGENPINSQPVTFNEFYDTEFEIGIRYYYAVQAIRHDSLCSYFSDELTILAGAPLPPQGLTAFSSLNDRIDLEWDENIEPDIDHYTIYRQNTAGEFEIIGTSEDNSFSDSQVENGVEYYYRITAVDDGQLESDLSPTVTAVPMGFTDELLVILYQPNDFFPLLEWDPDSLNSFYNVLFADIGENPVIQYQDAQEEPFGLPDISAYQIVWLIDDNHHLQYPPYSYIVARDETLYQYLDLGGRLIVTGRCLMNASFVLTPGLNSVTHPLLNDHFSVDSAFATRVMSLPFIHGNFISALSEDVNFPDLQVDESITGLLFNPFEDTALEIDGLTAATADVFYRYDSTEPDSSELQGMITGMGANNSTAILTFPLYMMEPYDDVLTTASRLLEYVRGTLAGVEDKPGSDLHPSAFRLDQNYPNPFNSTTEISYSVPENSRVEVRLFNILGEEVAVIAEGYHAAGVYRMKFDGKEMSSGLYFLQMNSGRFREVKKIILLK